MFEFITQCAILVMPTLLVFQMHPLRDYHKLQEWELFFIIEHLSILLHQPNQVAFANSK